MKHIALPSTYPQPAVAQFKKLHGPSLIDPRDYRLVAGGSPKGGWDSTNTQAAALSPKGGW